MKLANTNQVMSHLGISRTTLYRWMKKGWIKSYRTSQESRMIYFDLDELEEKLKENGI